MDTHIMKGVGDWLIATRLSAFVNGHTWVWPTLESLHFIGMPLLMGAVGLFDLRLMGFARQIPLAALHRFIRWGVLGFSINLLTGMCFVTAQPYEYIFNIAFQFKVLFILLAGVNILVFYAFKYPRLQDPEPGRDTPLSLKLIGGASLSLWIGVMIWGRLLTFFRPFGELHEYF